MKIRITKGAKEDDIQVLRDDGSAVRTRFPHKGPVPHDVAHLIVERQLGLNDSFWGKVARGAHPDELAAMAKAAGHASAKRAETPGAEIVEIIQAERIVEAFEAELWSDVADDESVLAMARSGCDGSLVPEIAMTSEAIRAIRSGLRSFRDRWASVEVGEHVDLEWQGCAESRA